MMLNELIKTRRKSLGMSQLKLAKLLGYPNSAFLNNIENNRCKLPRKKLKRACRCLFLDKKDVYMAILHDESHEIMKILGISSNE